MRSPNARASAFRRYVVAYRAHQHERQLAELVRAIDRLVAALERRGGGGIVA